MRPTFESLDGLSSDDVQLLQQINSTLVRLRDGRRAAIEVSGRYLVSKLAWKVATFAEGIRYRIVALAESLALNWNGKNALGCYLSARALIETSAVLLDFEHDLNAAVNRTDTAAIDFLCTNRQFSTRDERFLKGHPEAQAKNVLTMIDHLDKRRLNGIRKAYDIMSEHCHPNVFGHYSMFATLDPDSFTTLYSDAKGATGDRQATFSAMLLVMLVEKCFSRLDSEIDRVADLQR